MAGYYAKIKVEKVSDHIFLIGWLINNKTGCNNGVTIKSSNQSNDVDEEKMVQKSPNPSVSKEKHTYTMHIDK